MRNIGMVELSGSSTDLHIYYLEISYICNRYTVLSLWLTLREFRNMDVAFTLKVTL